MGPWRALSLPPASWPAPGPCGTPPSHYMPDFHRDQTNRICIASWGWVFHLALIHEDTAKQNDRYQECKVIYTSDMSCACCLLFLLLFAELQKAAAVITALPWLPFFGTFSAPFAPAWSHTLWSHECCIPPVTADEFAPQLLAEQFPHFPQTGVTSVSKVDRQSSVPVA